MPAKTQDPKDATALFSEHRDMPIFRRPNADGTFEFRSAVPTSARTYAFKADSLREIRVKIDIALDTP